MEKEEGISKYKLNKISTKSLRNTIRLHFDSVSIYDNDSHPSALQLSIYLFEVWHPSQTKNKGEKVDYLFQFTRYR